MLCLLCSSPNTHDWRKSEKKNTKRLRFKSRGRETLFDRSDAGTSICLASQVTLLIKVLYAVAAFDEERPRRRVMYAEPATKAP